MIKAEIQRTEAGTLMLSIHPETELEGIAIEKWQADHHDWLADAPLYAMLVSSDPK